MILIVDKMNIVKWWVDAIYEMNTNFWSHTGATMSLGWVSVASM